MANILLTMVTLYTKDMVWLIAGSVLGLLYRISRYFIDHPNISFPQSPANALTLLRICLLVITTMMSPGITLFEAPLGIKRLGQVVANLYDTLGIFEYHFTKPY